LAGRALATLTGIGGCIDVSDGLEADLAHLLERTSLVPELLADAIPRPPRFERRCARAGIDPMPLLLRGGEDYELLFTARASGHSAVDLSRRLRVPVTEIGRIRTGRKPGRAGKGTTGSQGFTHFRSA
jgi:thiamine-monophosphate kinase